MVHTILYDAECGFCRWSLAWILRWDRGRRLRPVALQDPEADELLAGMNQAERMDSWHLVGPEGDVLSAGAAAVPLLRVLPGGRPLAAIAGLSPRLTERVYRWVAEHRTLLARPVRPAGLRRADALIRDRSGGG